MQTRGMRTIDEIRRHNFLLLLKECGDGRGAAARLAALTGIAPALISQIKAATPHKSGAARGIGDVTARNLERGMQKVEGWMDRDHSEATTMQEADVLDVMRQLTTEQREHLLMTARMLLGQAAGKPIVPPG